MAPHAADKLVPEIESVLVEKPPNDKNFTEEEPQCECNQISYGDAVFSAFVVAPQVVSVWRGTWGIMELYPHAFPYVQTYILGITIHISFALIRTQLYWRSQEAWKGGIIKWVRERILSRIYTYIFVLSCIMHWRGGWGIFDAVVAAIIPKSSDPHRPVVIGAFTLIFYIGISILKSSKNILAPPYFLVTDGKEATYLFETRFRRNW